MTVGYMAACQFDDLQRMGGVGPVQVMVDPKQQRYRQVRAERSLWIPHPESLEYLGSLHIGDAVTMPVRHQSRHALQLDQTATATRYGGVSLTDMVQQKIEAEVTSAMQSYRLELAYELMRAIPQLEQAWMAREAQWRSLLRSSPDQLDAVAQQIADSPVLAPIRNITRLNPFAGVILRKLLVWLLRYFIHTISNVEFSIAPLIQALQSFQQDLADPKRSIADIVRRIKLGSSRTPNIAPSTRYGGWFEPQLRIGGYSMATKASIAANCVGTAMGTRCNGLWPILGRFYDQCKKSPDGLAPDCAGVKVSAEDQAEFKRLYSTNATHFLGNIKSKVPEFFAAAPDLAKL
ncbi:MAG TPA: hypothetical protein VM260_19890 [Pirellula sp.]|nr:hypothetical protein [Pirellula sp.]